MSFEIPEHKLSKFMISSADISNRNMNEKSKANVQYMTKTKKEMESEKIKIKDKNPIIHQTKLSRK